MYGVIKLIVNVFEQYGHDTNVPADAHTHTHTHTLPHTHIHVCSAYYKYVCAHRHTVLRHSWPHSAYMAIVCYDDMQGV